MKKIAIAASSVALAAMPVMGVFANDGTKEQTDTVEVTVESNCSLATSGSTLDPASTYTATIANGSFNNNIAGSTFTITCNDTAGWDLNAVGNGTATGNVAKMDASTNVDADDIATADGTPSGSTSSWAFKIAKGGSDQGNITITTGYDMLISFNHYP